MVDASRLTAPTDADAWVRTRVGEADPLELFQTEPWATVYRARVATGWIWLKVCAERQAFEVPVTATLSSRWPCAPEVLAHDVERRWLLLADAGASLRSLGNPPKRWLELLPVYAELQIGETPHAQRYLDVGVPDMRTGRLPELYDELVRATLPIDDDEHAAMRRFQPRFTRLCGELADAGIPHTVQHDDLHMNNVYVKAERVRILDWGDASIGFPFFSLFETFRFLTEMNGLRPDDAWFGRLRDAYLEPWGGDLRDAFQLALRLAAVARAIAWLAQRDALEQADRAAFDNGFDAMLRLALKGSFHA
jgi:hypothetical protein